MPRPDPSQFPAIRARTLTITWRRRATKYPHDDVEARVGGGRNGGESLHAIVRQSHVVLVLKRRFQGARDGDLVVDD